jgi:hypothetical protein
MSHFGHEAPASVAEALLSFLSLRK